MSSYSYLWRIHPLKFQSSLRCCSHFHHVIGLRNGCGGIQDNRPPTEKKTHWTFLLIVCCISSPENKWNLHKNKSQILSVTNNFAAKIPVLIYWWVQCDIRQKWKTEKSDTRGNATKFIFWWHLVSISTFNHATATSIQIHTYSIFMTIFHPHSMFCSSKHEWL